MLWSSQHGGDRANARSPGQRSTHCGTSGHHHGPGQGGSGSSGHSSKSSRGVQRKEEPSSRLRTDALVEDVYFFGDRESNIIGEGSFSEVLKVQHRKSGQIVACKRMQLPALHDPTHALLKAEILKEIDILCDLDHGNVMSLIEYFLQDDQIFLVMELVPGGNLMSVLQDRDCFSEQEAREIFVQLLHGIEHMHMRSIAHRDLKLENILICSTTPGDFSQIKIGDFGLAKRVDTRELCTTVCGTPLYIAPEVVSLHQAPGTSPYGITVDLWAAGVILYMLLAGYPPFDEDNHAELFAKVLSGNFCFDLPVWEGVSSEAKDLIVRLLVTDPSQRLTASEALLHPWIRCFYQQAKQPEPEPQHHKNAVSMVSLCAGLKSDLKRPMAAYSHRENKQRRSSSSQD